MRFCFVLLSNRRVDDEEKETIVFKTKPDVVARPVISALAEAKAGGLHV